MSIAKLAEQLKHPEQVKHLPARGLALIAARLKFLVERGAETKVHRCDECRKTVICIHLSPYWYCVNCLGDLDRIALRSETKQRLFEKEDDLDCGCDCENCENDDHDKCSTGECDDNEDFLL